MTTFLEVAEVLHVSCFNVYASVLSTFLLYRLSKHGIGFFLPMKFLRVI